MKVDLDPEWTTYYVRSTGEIVGPNHGETLKKQNLKRLDYGNLFVSERDAKRARKLIQFALWVANWRIWPL